MRCSPAAWRCARSCGTPAAPARGSAPRSSWRPATCPTRSPCGGRWRAPTASSSPRPTGPTRSGTRPASSMPPPLDWNGRSEEHLRASGVPFTLLRSGFYMTNLLMAAEQIRGAGSVFAPAGDGRIAMIDPRDIGEVAAVALTEPGHAGRSYRLTGPDAIAYGDVAAELSRATGARVR